MPPLYYMSFFTEPHYRRSLNVTSQLSVLFRIWCRGTWGGRSSASAWPLLSYSQCRLVYWLIPVTARQQLALWFSSTQWHFAAASQVCVCMCVMCGVCLCINGVCTMAALCDPVHLCLPGQALLSCLPLGPLFSADSMLQVPNTSGASHNQSHTHLLRHW